MPNPRLRKAGVTNEKFDRCVESVKSPGKNAFAICTASFNKKHGLRPKNRRSTSSR